MPFAAVAAAQAPIAHRVLEAVFAQAAGQASPLTTVGFLVVMVVIFYFFLIRPQSKQMKEHKAMLAALKKGDVVVTNGGIIGTVQSVADKFIVVEIAPSTRVKILAGSISGKAPESLLEEKGEGKEAKSEK